VSAKYNYPEVRDQMGVVEPRRGGNSKAQGNALGISRATECQALKGRHSAMQSDRISPLQGSISIGGTISQGVALG
jgi:hypothetical protein